MLRTIKGLRADLKLSQDDLAKKVGISRVTLGNIEKGKIVPDLRLARKIAKELKSTVDEIHWYE